MKRIAIACLQVIGALSLVGIALYLAQVGVDIKWIVIGSETLVFFGFVCYRTRDFWPNPRYWAVFGAAFVLHVVGVVLVQRNRPMFPGSYYGVFGTLEAILLLGLIIMMFS
jgi:magnesium-transporting ATPase (P-type)